MNRVKGISARIQDALTPTRTNMENGRLQMSVSAAPRIPRGRTWDNVPESKVEFNTWPQY